MPEYNPLPLVKAQEQFARLPGIGMKTAGRLAYHLLTMPVEDVEEFTKTIMEARQMVKTCKVCFNFTENEICPVCNDTRRNHKIICVVEAPKDVTVFERTGTFNGTYHVLHGLLSPIDNIGPNDIRIKELMARLNGEVDEVIMATNPTVEGEATATYISRMIKMLGIRVTRLAYGLPVGSSLEYADDVTLQKAIENRSIL